MLQQFLIAAIYPTVILVAFLVVRWGKNRPRVETPGQKTLKRVVAQMLSELTPAQQDAVNVLLIATRSDWKTALGQVTVGPTEFLFVSARLKEEVTPKSDIT